MMEEVDRHDILGTVDVDGRIQAAKLTSVDGNESELIGGQYMNLHRIPDNLQKVQLVTDPLSADILNQQVVELTTGNEFVNGTDGGQYYDDELLAHDLTEEDKRLAAALVAVQLVHQQKQQQFVPELLNGKSISPLSPLQSVGIEKPTVAAMVTSYFQAFDDDGTQPLYQPQPTSSPLPEIRLPPLKKVLSSHSIIRTRYDRSLLEQEENPEEEKGTLTKSIGCKQRKNDVICETNSRDNCEQEFNDTQSDLECESDLKPSRRSLPHKKRIPRKLKAQPGAGNVTRIPLHQHSLTKGYKCQKCGDTFISPSALMTHRASHMNTGGVVTSGNGTAGVVVTDTGGGVPGVGNVVVTGNISGVVTAQPVTVGCAMKKNVGTVSSGFSCELCGVTSINQIKFFEHLKAHYEPNIIQVDINDQQILEYSSSAEGQPIVQETYSVKSDSMQVLNLESEQELNCNQCGRIFRRKKALELHLATAHPTIEEFSEPEDMMEGIRHVVNIQTASPDEESDSKLRSWRLSDDLSIGDEILVDDVNKGDSSPTYKESDDKNKKRKKTVQCPHCSRTFAHRNSLLYHVRSHSGRRPHQCDVCGKGFFAANALKVHMRMHSGDKPYKCEVCLRHFRQWGDLKYHITSLHSSTKQYQCEFCGKDFARKYSLIVHRRIHTGEKNYVCEYCRKTFRASSYLVNHRRIHTGEKPYNCDVCHKPFRIKSDMKRHRNTHNKERAIGNTAANNGVGVGVVIESVGNQVMTNHRNNSSAGDIITVGDQIPTVDEGILTAGQIPLNLNMRQDSSDGLTGTLDRDPNTLYVWLPTTADSILPD